MPVPLLVESLSPLAFGPKCKHPTVDVPICSLVYGLPSDPDYIVLTASGRNAEAKWCRLKWL